MRVSVRSEALAATAGRVESLADEVRGYAHRLATLERADEILIVDRGRVVEHGLRAALASDPSSQFAHYLRVGLEEVLV